MAFLPNGFFSRSLYNLALLAVLPALVTAGDVISTESYSPCMHNEAVRVNRLWVQYNKDTQLLEFDVSGTSEKEQRVMAHLSVSAYGNEVYNKDFNPCDPDTRVEQLCPVPSGTFSAKGQQKIPDQYASLIPAIAFSFPDLDGEAKLTLTSNSTHKQVACIQSHLGNGMTARNSVVTYTAAGVAGAALLFSGLSSLSTFHNPGSSGMSPSFIETLTWFQSIAMNGMLSVNYPPVYRSFSQNFAFSTGLIPWEALQVRIDKFRGSTGGHLYHNNVHYLRKLAESNSVNSSSQSPFAAARRSVMTNPLVEQSLSLLAREIQVHANEGTGNSDNAQQGQQSNNSTDQPSFVNGIEGYVQTLLIPQSNIFMTVLLVFAIVIAAITAGILLFKVILEAWALFGSFPKGLVGFRKRYWLLLGKTITNLIMALYSVWTLYCIYQFTIGDSWAAKVLAGVTLGIFTAVLLFFVIKIWLKARQAKKIAGDTSPLYEDKNTWVKYSLFYDNYKRSYWWLFIPVIIYMFAKGCVIAAGYGHGLVQCGGQLIVDALLLLLLLWSRPYSFSSGNWINIIIQVVRVLSVICILVFVEELNVNQTTKTITGLALIVVQAVLTGVLAILIAVNWLIQVCSKNPHRKARKDAEKLRRDDELTPLDAHNSMLLYSMDKKAPEVSVYPKHERGRSQNGYDMVSNRSDSDFGHQRDISRAPLTRSAQGMGSHDDSTSRSISPDHGYLHREPQLPDVGFVGRGVAI